MAATLTLLSAEPLDASAIRAFVCGDPTLGGIVFFEGATRAENDPQHGALLRLDYEAHPTMARRKMEQLAEQAMNKFGVARVAIAHRTGGVEPGLPSVIIGVASGHRAEAFDACRWIIDTLKRDVPIWKKDVFEDRFVRWVESGNAE